MLITGLKARMTVIRRRLVPTPAHPLHHCFAHALCCTMLKQVQEVWAIGGEALFRKDVLHNDSPRCACPSGLERSLSRSHSQPLTQAQPLLPNIIERWHIVQLSVNRGSGRVLKASFKPVVQPTERLLWLSGLRDGIAIIERHLAQIKASGHAHNLSHLNIWVCEATDQNDCHQGCHI